MTARVLLLVVEGMLVEAHGREAVDDFLAPQRREALDTEARMLAVLSMDGEVA